jgi:hypothetical protein
MVGDRRSDAAGLDGAAPGLGRRCHTVGDGPVGAAILEPGGAIARHLLEEYEFVWVRLVEIAPGQDDPADVAGGEEAGIAGGCETLPELG